MRLLRFFQDIFMTMMPLDGYVLTTWGWNKIMTLSNLCRTQTWWGYLQDPAHASLFPHLCLVFFGLQRCLDQDQPRFTRALAWESNLHRTAPLHFGNTWMQLFFHRALSPTGILVTWLFATESTEQVCPKPLRSKSKKHRRCLFQVDRKFENLDPGFGWLNTLWTIPYEWALNGLSHGINMGFSGKSA